MIVILKKNYQITFFKNLPTSVYLKYFVFQKEIEFICFL